MGGIILPFKQRVLTVQHEEELCWEDSGWNSWFVSAHRCRTLETLPGGRVLLKQDVAIDGGLIGVAELFMGRSLRNGVAAETAALKWQAEH
ncbi:MAG: hypothetical protein H0T78_08750 [Longispora sp.]|nr:hypothetical protein [Longispora sp. (in: high G+C Gram-positive bacteria)]